MCFDRLGVMPVVDFQSACLEPVNLGVSVLQLRFEPGEAGAVIRGGGVGTVPKSTVMLMAGMMATAFGMVLTAFSFIGQPVEAAR